MSTVPLSVLDLASISAGDSVGQSLQNCVSLAQRAEQLGFTRVWYAEHHNFESIASSATSVLIAHVAAHTSTIRLGSGGVMLPNHSPLVIAEQFGTLASLHPGRIDLGLGRAPGTDQITMRALRRDPRAAENFADDIVELRAFLSETSKISGVQAMPGRGTNVPLYILGSSLYGAQVAAHFGLPFAFASHFAPTHLLDALRIYRERFTPSSQLDKPHAIASMNVIAADTEEDAIRQKELRRRNFTRALFSRQGQKLTDEEVEEILSTPQGAHVDQMFTYAAVGTTEIVKAGIENFVALTQADEIITAHHCESGAARIRSLELLAEATSLTPQEKSFLMNDYEEIDTGDTLWRFEKDFFTSNWICIWGRGCKGIDVTENTDNGFGCCSLGCELDGVEEAMNLSAYAAMIPQPLFQHFDEAQSRGIFANDKKSATRVVDGACIFLNRPGFSGGPGCALHLGAQHFGDSITEWKPSVCWQLPIKVDWEMREDNVEVATVHRWNRTAWGEVGDDMAWCCTEGPEAYCGSSRVIDSLAEEIAGIVGEPVFVELRKRLQ